MKTTTAVFRIALAILAGLQLISCSRKDDKPAAASPAVAPVGRYAAVAEVPEGVRQEVEAFGKEMETNCRGKQTQAIRAAFDTVGMASAICEGVKGPEQRLNEFRNGLQKGLLSSTEQIATNWSGQDSKFKGLALYNGRPAARFRFVSDKAGIAIMDLVVSRQRGKLRIQDVYNQAMGFGMIEQTKQATAPMLAELDKSFLERLLDQPKVPQADIERFGELAKQFRSGDFAGTVATYKSLPPALRETKLVTAIYLGALQRGNDDAGYKAALKQAAAKFKTANFQFMLVDMYYLDKEYDKAAGCVDAFMQAVGKDAALLALKSLMLNAKGDVPAARAALGEALQLEPDCVYAHAKGLDVLLAARDFPAVRDSMIFLEKNAGYNFRGALKGGIWADFKQAPESAQWR